MKTPDLRIHLDPVRLLHLPGRRRRGAVLQPRPTSSRARSPTAAHGFIVTATDARGRSGTSGVYTFKVDTKAPKTKIVGHPKKVIRTRKRNVVAHFKLKASEAPVTFYCQIDREAQQVCGKNFHHRFKPGKHVLKVRAKDGAGNLATKWTVFQFQVKKLRRAPGRRRRHRHRSHRSGG